MGVVVSLILDMSGLIGNMIDSDIAGRVLKGWGLLRVVCGVAPPRGGGKTN